MGTPPKLIGPDLKQGVREEAALDGVPLLGHVDGEPAVLHGDLEARDAHVAYHDDGRVRAVATIGRDRLDLEDVLETMGAYVDSLKFAGGSFALMPEDRLRELIELCHRHDVLVSTGGFIEHVLTQGPDAVGKYVRECKRLGFDIVEISAGFLTIPTDDWLRLVELVQKTGLQAKPEVGIQFGAGGATAAAELAAEGTRDVAWTIGQAKRFLGAGAYLIMIESEGITESVTTWRTDVATRLVDALGLDKIMFEAAEPEVFSWYVKQYGPEVNLFVDHSQIVQLEALRSGLWGTKSTWGRVVTFKG